MPAPLHVLGRGPQFICLFAAAVGAALGGLVSHLFVPPTLLPSYDTVACEGSAGPRPQRGRRSSSAEIQINQLSATTTTKDTPTGWESVVDPGSGKRYYFNRQTGISTWEKPEPPLDVEAPLMQRTGEKPTARSASGTSRMSCPFASRPAMFREVTGISTLREQPNVAGDLEEFVGTWRFWYGNGLILSVTVSPIGHVHAHSIVDGPNDGRLRRAEPPYENYTHEVQGVFHPGKYEMWKLEHEEQMLTHQINVSRMMRLLHCVRTQNQCVTGMGYQTGTLEWYGVGNARDGHFFAWEALPDPLLRGCLFVSSASVVRAASIGGGFDNSPAMLTHLASRVLPAKIYGSSTRLEANKVSVSTDAHVRSYLEGLRGNVLWLSYSSAMNLQIHWCHNIGGKLHEIGRFRLIQQEGAQAICVGERVNLTTIFHFGVHPTGPYMHNHYQRIDSKTDEPTSLLGRFAEGAPFIEAKTGGPPSIIIIETVLWDLARASEHEPREVRGLLLRAEFVAAWRANLTVVVKSVRSRYPAARIFFCTTPANDARTKYWASPQIEQLNAAGRAAARAGGFEVLDQARVALQLGNRAFQPDGYHPRPLLMLEALAQALNSQWASDSRVKQSG